MEFTNSDIYYGNITDNGLELNYEYSITLYAMSFINLIMHWIYIYI